MKGMLQGDTEEFLHFLLTLIYRPRPPPPNSSLFSHTSRTRAPDLCCWAWEGGVRVRLWWPPEHSVGPHASLHGYARGRAPDTWRGHRRVGPPRWSSSRAPLAAARARIR